MTWLSAFRNFSKNKTQNLNRIEKHSKIQLTDMLSLDTPQMHHFEQWKTVRFSQKDYLQPWEPTWHINEFSKASFKERVSIAEHNLHQHKGANYFLIHVQHGLIGAVNLFNIRKGASKSAFIGYWLSHDHSGNGYMTQAVTKLCEHGFKTIGLARIEASCLPDNIKSKKILQRCGFEEEGVGISFLEINGTRQDHLLFAKINPEI